MTSGLPWGLALSSGVNTYLPLFLRALFARFSHLVRLSNRFEWLISDQAIFVLGLLAVCETLAQKVPVLDNAWDFVHTPLRPLAGALAAGTTLTTNSALEIVLAMLMGGTLATAAHSTKSSLRLMSTWKSLGTANFVLSLAEDAAVLVATLLSVYAPWVMLAVVLLFVLIFAFIGPWLLRTLWFDLRILGAWLAWLCRWFFRAAAPANLRESLLELPPEQLERLGAHLEANEELCGSLTGWKRSRRGPRRTWLLLTSRRLLWIERRLFCRPKVQAMSYSDLSLARYRNLILFSKVEILARKNESLTLSMSKGHASFGEMAVQKMSELARLGSVPARQVTHVDPQLASALR